ncbi:MAG: hypothetical protein WKG06_32590 [Segetibacter sp.]
MKPLVIIEAPSNLGLKEPFPGKEPGVRKLPQWLRANGLYEILFPEEIDRVEAPAYSMDYDMESGVRNADKIKEYSTLLADKVFQYLNQKETSISPWRRLQHSYGLYFRVEAVGKV